MPDDSPTIYDFPFMQGDDAQAQARAMAQALRRQQMQGLALQALTGGQKAGPAVGQELSQQAGQQMNLGEKLLQGAPQYQMERLKAEQAQRQMAAQQHPGYAAGVQSLLGRYEPEVAKAAQGAPPQVLEQLLGPAERGYAARESARARMFASPYGMFGPSGGQGSPASGIADAIEQGLQPPDVKNLGRNGAFAVKSELAKRGFDLSNAQLDWQVTQKNLATLNGPQQLRIRQAAMTANDSLNNIEQLYQEWKQLGGSSGFRLLNKASLAMSKNTPGRLGAVAQALDMNIADLTSELGVVYMGGNTPTEEALRLARQNLSADWNEQQFTEAIRQARKNIGYRLNSIKHSIPAGLGGESRYAPKPPEPAAPAPPAGPGQANPLEDLRKKYGL